MAGHHDAAGHGSVDDQYLVTPPGAGYEHTDANVWLIAKFMFWLAISAVLIHLGVWGMFAVLVEQVRDTAEPSFPTAVGQEHRLPAEPRLQRFPANEALDFRQQEAAGAESYRWVDRAAGTVQIPITEAMRLTVERGLPARVTPQESQGPEPSGLIPADSSSGRTMEQRR
jgi:hypothetical protein